MADYQQHQDPEEEDQDGDDEEQQPRLSAASYGALDTVGASWRVSDECWLIRLPQALAKAWQEAPEGTHVGDLVFTKGGPAAKPGQKPIKPSFSVHVSQEVAASAAATTAESKPAAAAVTSTKPNGGSAKALPLNYSLQAMTKKVPVLHPFDRNPKNGRVQLLGRVSRTANLQVEQDQTYRAMLKDRLVATTLSSNRFVKPVDATESVMSKKQAAQNEVAAHEAAATATSGNKRKRSFGDAVLKFGKRMMEAAESSAAQQRNAFLQQQQQQHSSGQFKADQEMRSVLFALFQQQPYWAVKDLKAAAVAGGATSAGTKKGESELRELLRDIGDYHRSGDHKNMWELRKEFRQG